MLKIEVRFEVLEGYVNYELPIIFSKIYLYTTILETSFKVL